MLEKLRVLVVEDEGLIARCICEDLKDLDVEPLKPVPKGEIAVDVALKEKPDLILMDIRLAGAMDGIEAAQKIKEKGSISIIFMSGYATEDIKEQALGVDCIGFFEKPVTVKDLTPIINQLKKSLT